MMPKGYLKTNYALSREEAERIKEQWEKSMRKGETVILGKGVEFIPFPQQDIYDKSIVQCGHCGQWAAVQTECKHCGATVL